MKHALRGLLKSPGFFVVAVLTLALGIGANTAIFTVVYTVLLRPLPFGEPERLAQIWETRPERGWSRVGVSPNFWDYREQNRTFVDMGAMGGVTDLTLTGLGFPQRIHAARVTSDFFKVLRIEPALGRMFIPGQDQPGGEHREVLLSNEFWRTRFVSDPGIVGRSLTLDDESYTVVGVLPRGRPWLDAAQLFTPMVRDPDADRRGFGVRVIGRLAPGTSIEMARSDLEGIYRGLQETHPELRDEQIGFLIEPARMWMAGDRLRKALWVLLGAVGFLLLIASVNIANLLLARATARQRETAIRAALGAGRARLLRYLLAESVLLGFVGAGLGLVLAMGAIRLVRLFDPGDVPRLAETSIDATVLGFTLVVGLLSGVSAGLAPAFRLSYASVLNPLRAGEHTPTSGRAQRRAHSVLVCAEVALSLMLLMGAGLLMRSFGELMRVDRGFQSENRLFFTTTLSPAYRGRRTSDFIDQLLSRLNALPQVLTSAAVHSRPIDGSLPVVMGIQAAGEARSTQEAPLAAWRVVTKDYFRSLGVPLLQGRLFTERDTHGPIPIGVDPDFPWRVIVSERLAELLWPGGDAVGRQAVLWVGEAETPAEIVGVVGDMRERGLDSDPTLTVYLPFKGAEWAGSVDFLVHASGDPLPLVSTLRAILTDLDPSAPISNVKSVEAIVEDSVAARRFNMALLTVLSSLALVLALVGIYGVQSYSVARRSSEIGIRVALGATENNVIRLIAGQAMVPALVGIALGLVGALAVSRLLSSLLFGIAATDATTYVTAVLLVTGAALVACYVPARRAMEVDPATALRDTGI